jgi:hypothetical protein
MWRLPQTSGYSSVSHGDSNRCTPFRRKTRCTQHVCFPCQFTYAPSMLPTGSWHTCQPFTLTQQSWTDSLLLRKSALDSTSQLDWVVHRTCLSFSPNIAIEAVRLSQASVEDRLHWWTHKHQQAIHMFNTCSRGPTHRSLTNTAGCYNLGGASLPQTTPWPSQPMVLHFPPKGPARYQVIHPTITDWTWQGTNPKSHEWEPLLDFYRNLSSKHSMS